MAIPGSGPISMSMFNTAVNRAASTANSLLAGGLVPADPGLFYLGYQYNNTLNQDAPHAMSEWYDYYAIKNIPVYAKASSTITAPTGQKIQIQYKIDAGSWTNLGSPTDSTTCIFIGTINAPVGSQVYVAVIGDSGGGDVNYDAVVGPTTGNCPASVTPGTNYYCKTGNAFVITATFATSQNVGINAVVTAEGSLEACPVTTTTTTTSTTTTTTTAAPVTFYELTLCTAGGPDPAYTTNGPFSLNERVVYAGSLYYTVSSVAKTNPPDTPVGTQISVTTTGETGCPTTTTTTTTLPPVTATNGPITCAGSLGSFTTTFTGGTGTYVTAAIDTSEANVGQRLGGGPGGGSGQTIILSPGATSYTWTNLAEGTSWFVGVKDSANGSDLTPQITITCPTTTTTTTSTTTTTTTLAPFVYAATGSTQSEVCNATQNVVIYYTGTGLNICYWEDANATVAVSADYIAIGSTVWQLIGGCRDYAGDSCDAYTTTTSTTTTTTTQPPQNTYSFDVASGTSGPSGTACSNAGTANYTDTLYTGVAPGTGLVDDTYYYQSDGITPFNGGGNTYSDGTIYGTIAANGFFNKVGDCNIT